ncbi:MAG: hypothetical protein AB8B50_20540, partial [Pirellulaceae bacterium]
ICSLADVRIPDDIVGADLSPLLQSANAAEIHDAVLMTYKEGNHSMRKPTSRFTRYSDSSTELYYMLTDPKQQTNLAGRIEFAPAEMELAATLDRELSGATKAKKRSAPKEPTQMGNNPLQVNGHNFYGAGKNAGLITGATVGLIDLYPTLSSVCGLPKTSHQLDGRDISPLLAEPTADWKHPAITTYDDNMFSLQSGQWRYIRYSDGSEKLYDYSKDPHEFNNKASQPELESTKAKFRSFIPTTFTKSLGGRNR